MQPPPPVREGASVAGSDAAKALPNSFYGWLLAAVCVVAAALRFYASGSKGIWVDEAFSIGVARLNWTEFFRVLWNREVNMALYYAILHFWAKAGTSAEFLRALSILFSVATIPFLYALGKRTLCRTTALLACTLLAVNAFHIRYAQEARSYALLAFLAVLATWLLVRNLQEPDNAHWLAYAIAAALMVYAHVLGGLVVSAHAVSLLWFGASRESLKQFLASMRWLATLVLPIVFTMWHIGARPVSWIQPLAFGNILYTLEFFAGNRGLWLLGLEAALLSWAAISFLSRRDDGDEHKGLLLALTWLFLPMAILLAMSAVRPLFITRYIIFCLPPLTLAVAEGIRRIHFAPARWLALAAVIALSLQGTASYYQRDVDIFREDWRSATAFVLDRTQAGDGILFAAFCRPAYEYYKSQIDPAAAGPAVLNWPGDAELKSEDFAVQPIAEMLRDARPTGNRVWLMVFQERGPDGQIYPADRMLRASLGRDRRVLEDRDFSGVSVVLFARNPVGTGTAPTPIVNGTIRTTSAKTR